MSVVQIPVRISNLHSGACIDVEARIDTSYRMLVVPSAVALALDLPNYAFIQYKDTRSVTPLQISDSATEVIVGLGTLTGLCLDIDRHTGELRTFEPMLPSVW